MSGLYLHIPFCESKCPYCDFYSLYGDDDELARYVDLLRRELQQKTVAWEGPFDTLFFGGGTPSRLTPAQVAHLLQTVTALYGISADAELSLEANPGTVTRESLTGYHQAGINRLSLGMQSFDDRALHILGRRHTATQGKEAFRLARETGFENLSCDLIFALPEQTPAALDREIDQLLALAPEHISAYVLTLEEGTPLFHHHQQQPLPLPDDEQSADLFLQIHRRLTAAGYRHYEISNYARPGRECRHNLATWQRKPYLGVGAGAHSFRVEGWGARRAIPDDLARYRDALLAGDDPSEELERFDEKGAMSETLYLALRTETGMSETTFAHLFGTSLADAFPDAQGCCGDALITENGHWRFSPAGWLLFNHFIQHFFLEK